MKSIRGISAVFVLAGILLNNWIVGIFINWHLFTSGGSVSEFSAANQPHSWLFRVLDVVAGLMILAGSIILFRYARNHRFARIISISGMILGPANCLDALLPLPCSGTVNPDCSAPLHISLHRISLPDHALSSVIIAACFLLMPLAGTALARAHEFRIFHRLSIAAVFLMVLFLAVLTIESFWENRLTDHLVGLAQQLQMLVFGVWFALLSWQIKKLD
ncbi:MAG TPA: DUF998 domain-containing protein [Candidatus Saccharimonadales bacterium]|nr:DUF998 domain-containing protein [Candidatus Saccharimonadales bacterium]